MVGKAVSQYSSHRALVSFALEDSSLKEKEAPDILVQFLSILMFLVLFC